MSDQPPIPSTPGPGTNPDPDAETAAYTVEPERRPEWASPGWSGAPWPEPTDAAQPPSPDTEPVQPIPVTPVSGPRVRRPEGLGRLVATAALSAVLASGGTLLVLESSGALNRPFGASAQTAAQQSNQPVAIDESGAIVDVASRVSPAVVRITAEGTTTDPLGGTLPESGIGSGVIYDAGGWILTNKHVVTTGGKDVASKLTVDLKDGRTFTGTVYGVDTLTDLAIVKIQADGLTAATIGHSADLKVGQLVIAIGSPLGTYTSTVTSGIVSATGRSITVDSGDRINNLIQTDAAINPGNSGGPLLDAGGQIVGINTAVERGSTGIGFAIPVDIARPIMAQALAGQPLARPYLGIRYEAIDVKLQQDKKLSVDHGALIGGTTDDGQSLPAITPGSPAEKAGLKENDIVLAIEGQDVDAEHPLDALLTSYAPGQTIKLSVLRDGKTIEVSVTLGTRPADLGQ